MRNKNIFNITEKSEVGIVRERSIINYYYHLFEFELLYMRGPKTPLCALRVCVVYSIYILANSYAICIHLPAPAH